jgi:hypothetical protein
MKSMNSGLSYTVKEGVVASDSVALVIDLRGELDVRTRGIDTDDTLIFQQMRPSYSNRWDPHIPTSGREGRPPCQCTLIIINNQQ